MRVKPSHVQIGLASLMGVVSLVLLFSTVVPQLRQSLHYQQQQDVALSGVSIPALAQLPKIDRNTPAHLQQKIYAPLKTTAQETKVTLKKLDGDLLKSVPIGSLPPTVQKVPLTFSASGSYPQLQAFQQKLMTLFPYIVIREMNYELKPEAVVRASANPTVDATWVFDIIVSMS